jgi:hypothetical protein
MKLIEMFRHSVKVLQEGGNVAIGKHQAQQINLQVTNRSYIVPILNKLLKDISIAYSQQHKTPLWEPKLLKSQQFLSGSSLHFFNVKDIPDQVFVEKKPKVGDIDTMVAKDKEENLEQFLSSMVDKKIGSATLLGFQQGNEQFSSLWELQDPPIKIQIDLEFVQFVNNTPTAWSRFSHSSSWDDIQAGVKGVFHKFLIQSFGVLTKKQFLLRKQVGRGKSRTWQDIPTEDNMISFAVSSKEGGGLRAKYTPVVNPQTNEPEVKDGLPVMMELPSSGYEQDINKIFQNIFGVKMSEKAAQKLEDKFWSFIGLLDVMNSLLDKEEKDRILRGFLNKLFGKGAQGLYKNDPERDIAEKNAALELLMKKTGAAPPEGLDIDQMRQEYIRSYKMTSESLEEEDNITAPPKPNYARQGIQHLYSRLPDGRVSSMEMKDQDFIDLCKEISENGGTLDGMPITLKVDGAGIRFGKDESGRPFFMTSKVTQPLYKDNIGYFTNFGIEKGQSEENLSRTKKYDDALSLIVNSKFIQTLPNDTIVQAEMMYNDMAQEVDGQLKFVSIPYDPKKLGKQMTLVPFMAKQFSTGEIRSDQNKIIQKLLSASDSNIKIVTNKLDHKGINVSKIIDPVVNMDSTLVSSLQVRGSNPQKEQAKAILDQARQQLSSAIIDSSKLKGKNVLGNNMEGIVVSMPSGRIFKVTSQQMKSAMAAKMAIGQFGDTNTRTAVVAIGNFAGHRGHEDLINFAVEKAQKLDGTPFIYVGSKVGPDDPIDVKTKIETLQKLFPGVEISAVENQMTAAGDSTTGNHMKKIEYELVKKKPYYNNIIITVGSDQAVGMAKWAETLQARFRKFPPLAHVKISVDSIERDSSKGGSGWNTTALRNSLKNKPQDQAFQDWSRAYNVGKLGADWINHLMNIARKNMGIETPSISQNQQPVKETVDPIIGRKSFLVADTLYNMNPRLFSEFGDEFLMSLIQRTVKSNPNESVKNIIGSIIDKLKNGIEEAIEKRVNENLHKWFKEKWVRFGPDGKIRGDCARGDDSEGKPKCLPQSKAQSLGKKGRASAAARKRREDPNPERSGKAINVATKKKTDEQLSKNTEEQLDEIDTRTLVNYLPRAGASLGSLSPEKRARRHKNMISTWKTVIKRPDGKEEVARYRAEKDKEQDMAEGKKDSDELAKYENDVKTLLANGDVKTAKKVAGLSPDAAHRNHLRNIIRRHEKQGVAEEKCPHCSGPMFSEELMMEKKDACYYKVKSRYKVWPSAYASGALVQCRKRKGKWGSKKESTIPISENTEQIISALIDKIIVNEAIQNKK